MYRKLCKKSITTLVVVLKAKLLRFSAITSWDYIKHVMGWSLYKRTHDLGGNRLTPVHMQMAVKLTLMSAHDHSGG